MEAKQNEQTMPAQLLKDEQLFTPQPQTPATAAVDQTADVDPLKPDLKLDPLKPDLKTDVPRADHPVLLITGGSSGIGKVTCEVFAQHGYTVYEISRRGSDRPGIIHLTGDVTKPSDMIGAVETLWSREGRLDVVISNAGFGISGPVELTSPEDVYRQFDVNVFGSVNLIRAVIPALRASGGGRLLCTSSVAAVTPIPFQSFYTCTKACVNQLVLALNNELRPFNISCAAVMPGDISTGFTDHRCKTEGGTDIYGKIAAESVAKMEKDERSGGSPLPLANRFYKLATQKRRPKPLSGSGAVYRILLVLAKLLPARFMNYILWKMYAS